MQDSLPHHRQGDDAFRAACLFNYIGGHRAASKSTVAPVLAVKVPRLETPETRAVTVLSPSSSPSVRVVCARPLLFVVTLSVESDPPLAVTANVTVAPETGSSFASTTSTTNGFARRAPGLPLWLSPEILLIASGG